MSIQVHLYECLILLICICIYRLQENDFILAPAQTHSDSINKRMPKQVYTGSNLMLLALVVAAIRVVAVALQRVEVEVVAVFITSV